METIKITCKGADTLPIDRILEFQGNLKKLTNTNRDRLKRSILRHGFTAPLFVWDDSGEWRLLDGHQRLATLISMRKEGYDIPMLPVDYIEAKDEKEAREKLLNITSQYGEFDTEELSEWLKDCDEELRESIRLVDEELELSINSTEEVETVGDDDMPEEVEPVTKLGDLWELGEHRLLCGDSTKAEDIEKLMNGQKADMVFTDPPYNIDYQGVSDKRDKIKNDKMSDSDFVKFLEKSLMGCETMYVCCSWQYSHLFKLAMENISRKPKAMIIWDKVNPAQHLDKYFKQHEIIFYYGDFGGHKTLRGDVWKLKRERNTVHPTMKPVELIEMALIDQPDKNLVFDSFLGSGSTIIASERQHKKCYGLELDEHYCDVIRDRYIQWCENNGKDPVIKLNGEVYKWQDR